MKPEHLLILIGTIYLAPTLPKNLGTAAGLIFLLGASLVGMKIL